MATQLRRYTLPDAAGLDRLVAWFPTIVAVREKYGFKVEFAYADHENLQFVWAVSHPGDFAAAMGPYENSPERAAAFADFESPVQTMVNAMVDQVI